MATAWDEMTALELGAAIGADAIDPVDLADFFLDRIAAGDPDHLVYLRLTPERARAEAAGARARAQSGMRLGPLDGVPLSWKDLVDMAGVETNAAARALKGRVPAHDAPLLARATRAGTVCLGKTNMTEFAFSGLGINTTYGTPANACDDKVARIPGGSSSGAAVSVARGLAPAGIGSDTGGSVRIPASLNGLVGLKTTAGSLPLDGILPLAPSLDTIGPLTRDVADANAVWAILRGRPGADLAGANMKGKHLLAVENSLWQDVDPGVDRAVREGLEILERAGAQVTWARVDEVDRAVAIMGQGGGLVTTEAYACWGDLVEDKPELIFPFMLSRFRIGLKSTGIDVVRMLRDLDAVQAVMHRRLAGYDAMIAPTVPISPPPIAGLIADEVAYHRTNRATLRNTTPGNLLKLCALTLPCGTDGLGLPAGLMVMQRPHQEAALLRLGKAMETALAGG
jgi:aspartyl-tRNA(Asn)/glutamyl-tRNA(Gln) amidotransferase subunit A